MRILTMAALAVATSCASVQWTHAQEAPRRLSVVGSGTVSAVPDLARVTFGVTVQRPLAADAFAEAAAAMRAILAAAAQAGVPAIDLRTTDISLAPVYKGGVYDSRKIDAYSASHQVLAIVRNLDALGPLLDATARAGATDFGGVMFDVADRATLLDEARAAAVADAARAAAVLSEGAHVALGAPVEIVLVGASGPERAFRAVAMSDSAMPIAPGAIEVTASVSVTYALE